MKRLQQTDIVDEQFPAAAIYLDDVEVIVEEFKKHGHEVVFKDEDYEFDNLADVVRVRGTKPKRLVLETRNQHGPSFVFARWEGNGLRARRGQADSDRILLATIRELLGKRQVWFSQPIVFHTLATAAWSSLAFLLFAQSLTGKEAPGSTFWFLIGSWVMAGIASAARKGFGSTLDLAHRHAAATFLSRHAEKIVYTTIGGIAGALAKALIDRLFS